MSWLKCYKISSTFLFLFSNKMLIFRTGIHKMLVRIANSEVQFLNISLPISFNIHYRCSFEYPQHMFWDLRKLIFNYACLSRGLKMYVIRSISHWIPIYCINLDRWFHLTHLGPMEFPTKFDTVKTGCSIVCIEGPQVIISNFFFFFVWRSILSNQIQCRHKVFTVCRRTHLGGFQTSRI